MSAPPPPKPVPKLAFTNKAAIIAPASSVSFQNDYTTTSAAPHVEQAHDVRPDSIARLWVDKRLKSTSMAHGNLTLTVLDASVLQEELPRDTSFKARLLTRQPEYRLVGKLRWRLTYKGPILARWTSEGTAEASASVLEQSSINDQEQAYADLIDGIAQNFDARVEDQITNLRKAQSNAVDATGH
ncbi:MAG TPA: hypothetical protein VEH07_09935 [Alphaproteobacteria bacterium]|nr:hypothetical protein [Alphaproteobacteria bacterium]